MHNCHTHHMVFLSGSGLLWNSMFNAGAASSRFTLSLFQEKRGGKSLKIDTHIYTCALLKGQSHEIDLNNQLLIGFYFKF